MVIFGCYMVENEPKKIYRECCKHLESTELITTTKNDLFIFATIVNNDLPKFTAAGFFPLTRGTILSVLNATATYIIVSFQFR